MHHGTLGLAWTKAFHIVAIIITLLLVVVVVPYPSDSLWSMRSDI